MPLRITYLLDDTEITGRTRVLLTLTDALAARGHHVRIVTKGQPPTWRSSRAEWIYVDDFREYDASHDTILEGPLPIAVDDEIYRAASPREHEPLRVLLPGAAQVETKGVDDGYGAVAHARWFHQSLDLIRVSPWVPSREEPLEAVQEFHVALTTAEMTRLLHSCDVMIVPSHAAEGLSLAVAEAMAAGLPTLLTTTSSHLSLDPTPDYALFGPEQNAVELGERLIELLTDPALRDRLRTRGREVAEQWRVDAVAERVVPHAQ